ncbi:hypothetical protein DL96DRAFT_1707790 [Flagelloscypha sp. PMI_526]|nr:hypothetical protein DL96DRAFT_1707790 [Flagelloscypha sp. PMI_526]
MFTLKDLPPEVLESSLTYCDKPTLAKCCLVNSTTRQVARPLLFYSLLIGDSLMAAIQANQFPYFHMIWVVRIEIPEYTVEDLALLVERLAEQFEFHPVELHVNVQEPITDEEILYVVDVLQTFPQSSSFLILHMTMFLGQPSVATLWSEAASTIIKDVRIIEFSDWVLDPQKHSSRPAVETLQLESIPTFNQIRERIDLSHLTRLSINPQNWESAEELIRHVAGSLEAISISNPYGDGFFDPSIFFGIKFPKLKFVGLWLRGSHNDIESWLVPMISGLSAQSPQFESIGIYISLGSDMEPEREVNEIWLRMFESHAPLGSALGKIKGLNQVQLALDSFGLLSVPDETRDEMTRDISQSLRGCQQHLSILWCPPWRMLWPFFEPPLFPIG